MKDKIILLVEDNPDDVELAIRALKKNNAASDFLMGSPNILYQGNLKQRVGFAGGIGNRSRPPQ